MMKSSGSSIWLLISIVVINSLQCIHCGTSPGETLPDRLEIEINSSANITCRINPSKFGGNVNSSSLYFEQEDTKYIVPNDNIHILNDTTIVFMLRNATEQDRYYICKIGTKGIGITHVSVGTAPLDITDFKCRGYDYTYMVCNFTKPHNVLLTHYNLSYTAQSPNYIQTCHLEMQQNQGICNLTMDKNNYRPNYEFYNFTLKGQNEVGVNVQSFWINHYESVIPPRPEYTIEKITNNMIIIKWNNPKYSFYTPKGLDYEILFKAEGAHWANPLNYEIRNNRSEYKVIVRNLPYAYFWYELSVRIRVKKSARNDDSYWSEPYVQKFQTLPCPPDTAPITDVGSFYIDSSETKVRLYWHQLPYYKYNGPDFKYVIKEVKRDGVSVSLKPLHIDLTSATFPWHKRHNYTFVIKSSNAEGESPNNSTIVIPARSKHHERSFSPQWIRNVYHATNRTSTLSWSPPHNQKHLTDYTVFWCQSKLANTNECEGTIFFEHVSKESTQYYTSPQKQEEVQYNLAVSANYRDFNTGMHWTMCSADVTSELVKLEPEIIDVKSRSITVQWSTDRVCSSLVEGFNLIYCRIQRPSTNHIFKREDNSNHNCLEEPTKLTIENTAKRYTMQNLKPYSSYKIQMNMFSKLTPGNLSDAQIIYTHEDAPSKPHNLRAYNVTSNSVVLTWSEPKYRNGLLTKYRIAYNNEYHNINCQTNEEQCASKQVEYKLENLSSYTTYKIYITAYTSATAASNHSNDITVTTLVGIPSNPRNVKRKDNDRNILQWSRPEVPSGRVEFYEVAITYWYKDQIQRQHISLLMDTNECEYHLPACIDGDYRFTKEVRAVNVVPYTEIDHNIFATKNATNDDVKDLYTQNMDMRCVGKELSAEQLAKIHEYQDKHKYVQYKSVWEKGPATNCSDPELSRITMLALLIVVSSLGVMAAFYVARNKYQKMANISCALPPGLEEYPIKDNGDGGDDFRRSKDPFYNNESRRLLSSISHDSGYVCHNGDLNNGGLNGIAACSLGKSSGYIGSNNSTDYCTQETFVATDNVSDDSCVIDQTPVVDDAYMVMELLKSNDNKLSRSSSSTTFDNIISQSERNGNGYVQPNFSVISALSGTKNTVPSMTATKLPASFMPTDNGYIKQIPTSMHTQLLPSENGYIKPNNLLNWPREKMPTQQTSMAHATQLQNTMAGLPINSSGYVAPQLLQKPLIPSSDGYTSLEALGKTLKSTQPTMSQTFINPDEGGGGNILNSNMPPISGYVTQKELSAFGQQQKFN
ncbi:cytokine receptor-like isoform X2 [Lucilia sericata]|uniref:cytokine receptor-like isoform X2 n=1 Tax=Lucilia sericata TaxID=13632 RepID=UPI0018A7E91E|nr:cytokine receptor-like isoform X2 [Lucilia sericata]